MSEGFTNLLNKTFRGARISTGTDGMDKRKKNDPYAHLTVFFDLENLTEQVGKRQAKTIALEFLAAMRDSLIEIGWSNEGWIEDLKSQEAGRQRALEKTKNVIERNDARIDSMLREHGYSEFEIIEFKKANEDKDLFYEFLKGIGTMSSFNAVDQKFYGLIFENDGSGNDVGMLDITYPKGHSVDQIAIDLDKAYLATVSKIEGLHMKKARGASVSHSSKIDEILLPYSGQTLSRESLDQIKQQFLVLLTEVHALRSQGGV